MTRRCRPQPLQPPTSRRTFLQTAGVFATSLALPSRARAGLPPLDRPIKIGLIADLHHDVMHDGPQRLAAFLNTIESEQPDAVMQLGDFAYPNKKNRAVTEAFQQAHPRAWHVLGNHDIDDGHSFEEVVKLWGMKGRYYTETVGGLHVVVLDGNEKPPDHQGGYPHHIGPVQLDWLRSQLEDLDGPIVVFCHQPLAGPSCVDNSAEVQAVLNEAAEKILLTVNGHTHIDHVVRADKIINLHINSASYYWVGGKHVHESYANEIHAAYPDIQYTCPYDRPLFTTLMIDQDCGQIHLFGRQAEWVGKSPAELGSDSGSNLIDGEEICPRIRARTLRRPPV